VGLADKPTFETAIAKGTRFEAFRGRDTFKTWLIAMKEDGPRSQITFLRRWDWTIDWGDEDRTARGIEGFKETADDSGAEAVLSGTLAPGGQVETPMGPYDVPRLPDTSD
jgi:hypothetical protein